LVVVRVVVLRAAVRRTDCQRVIGHTLSSVYAKGHDMRCVKTVAVMLLTGLLTCLLTWPAGASDDPFGQGNWVFQTYGSGGFGDEAGELYSGHIGVGYHFLDDVSVNVDLMFGYADIAGRGGASGGEAVFGGLDMLFRWHFWRGEGWSVYVDGGAGLMQSGQSYPAHGSHFNFRPQMGMGATLRLTDHMLLMGGARWLHVSNADLPSGDNPGADMAMVYLGLMIPF
jgi:hypothetical protein